MARPSPLPVLGIAAGAAALVGGYRWGVRPWHERWGATDAEVDADLPGDDLIEPPFDRVTRAITIDAPVEAVWPWIVQLGADRGGFYSHDALENLFGLGIHSAARIVPEWQDLAVGDVVAADARRSGGWYVVELRPREALVLQVADLRRGRPTRRDEGLGWEFQWTFAVRPLPGDRTRLLVGERTAFGRPWMRIVMAPVGLVSFVMTRRMLVGIKQRAEGAGTAPDPEPSVAAVVR